MAVSDECPWRERLHTPEGPEQVTPSLQSSLKEAEAILWPSLSDPAAHAASLLLIAPPDGGKSLFTRLLTTSLSERLKSDGKNPPVIARLDAITTTPAQVWRELAAALNAASLLDDTSGKDGPSAPVNAVEPSATSPSYEEDVQPQKQVEDSPSLIRPALDRLREKHTPLLVVLDHFHRLATPDPLAQTVLYTLFNLLQDRTLSAACIALTAVVDVEDLLEKRVKSRFAARPLVLPQPSELAEIVDLVRTALQLEDPVATPKKGKRVKEPVTAARRVGTRGSLQKRQRTSASTPRSSRRASAADVTQDSTPVPAPSPPSAGEPYQRLGEILLSSDVFTKVVSRHLARSRPVAAVLRAVDAGLSTGLAAESQRNAAHHPPTKAKRGGSQHDSNDEGAEMMLKTFEEALGVTDPYLAMVGWLTERQLKLLIALCRVATDPKRRALAPGAPGGMRRVGFDEVFHEVSRFGRGGAGHLEEDAVERGMSRDIATREWEALVECGLVIRARKGLRDTPAVYCAVNERLVFETVRKTVAVGTMLKNWARPKVVQT